MGVHLVTRGLLASSVFMLLPAYTVWWFRLCQSYMRGASGGELFVEGVKWWTDLASLTESELQQGQGQGQGHDGVQAGEEAGQLVISMWWGGVVLSIFIAVTTLACAQLFVFVKEVRMTDLLTDSLTD